MGEMRIVSHRRCRKNRHSDILRINSHLLRLRCPVDYRASYDTSGSHQQ